MADVGPLLCRGAGGVLIEGPADPVNSSVPICPPYGAHSTDLSMKVGFYPLKRIKLLGPGMEFGHPQTLSMRLGAAIYS
jgi:hypothetical protein